MAKKSKGGEKEKKKTRKQLKAEKKAAEAAAAAALAEAEAIRLKAEEEQERARLEEEAAVAAEMARLEEIRAAEVAAQKKREKRQRVRKGMMAWAQHMRMDEDQVRRRAARERLRAHRQRISVTVVEAKLWESHPFHVSCAVTCTPGEITRTTSTLHGACAHPVWHSRAPGVTLPARRLWAGAEMEGDPLAEPTAEGETLTFEIGDSFRMGIIPTLTIEVMDGSRGTVAYATLPLSTPSVQRRHFLDPETAARRAVEAEVERRKAAQEAEKAALKRRQLEAPKVALIELIIATAARLADLEPESDSMVKLRAELQDVKLEALKKRALREGVDRFEMLEATEAAVAGVNTLALENQDRQDGSESGSDDEKHGNEVAADGEKRPGSRNSNKGGATTSRASTPKPSSRSGSRPGSRSGTPKSSRAGTPKPGSRPGSRAGTPKKPGSRAGSRKGSRSGTPKKNSKAPKKKKKKSKHAKLDVVGVTKALSVFQNGNWFDIGYNLEDELRWLDVAVWLPLRTPGSEGDPTQDGAAGKVFLRLKSCGPEVDESQISPQLTAPTEPPLPRGWATGDLDDGSTFYYPIGQPEKATKQRPTEPALPLALLPGAVPEMSNLAWNIFHPDRVTAELKMLAAEQAERERKARQAVQLEKVWAEVDQDGSGMLDAIELKTVLLKMGRTDNIDEVLKQIDEDGSGEVDYDEFCEWFQMIDQPSKPIMERNRSTSTGLDGTTVETLSSAPEVRESELRHHVDIDMRQFGMAKIAAGEARVRAIALERRALRLELEKLTVEKAEAEAAHAIAEVKRELDEVLYRLNAHLDEVSNRLNVLQEEEETIKRTNRGELTDEEEASILKLEDLQVAEPSRAAQFLLAGGAHSETAEKLSVEDIEEDREYAELQTKQYSSEDGSTVEQKTLVVPANGESAELTLGYGGDGASEHTMHVSAAVDKHGMAADVAIDFAVDAFDGQRRLFGMPNRLQLAGSVVTVTARSNVSGTALGLFDDCRVKLTLAHCHAGPPKRLRVLHEATAVAGDNIGDSLLVHEWDEPTWSELYRGEALATGPDAGFVSFVAPRPGRYVVARAMVDPKAQRRGAQGDLDRVYILPTPRHSGAKLNLFEPLSFALTAFPAQKDLLDGLVAMASLGDLSSNWPIADGTEQETAPPVFGVSKPRVGGPFVVARGRPVTIEMLLPDRAESGSAARSEEQRKSPSAKGTGSLRGMSPDRQPRRRSPLRSALSSRLSSVRSSISSARSSLSSRVSPLRNSPQRGKPTADPKLQPAGESVLDLTHLPDAVSLLPQAVTSVDWWGQPGAALRLGVRLEADASTVHSSVQLPFQLSLSFQIPKLDTEHLSLSVLLDKKSELDVQTQEQAMILQAAHEEELSAEPAQCLVRFVADGRPWSKMFAGDCLGVHLGEIRADQTSQAQAGAAAEAMLEHRAATKLQKVWRGKVGRAKQLQTLFLQYDYDNSGTLEREEVASLLRKLGATAELANINLTMARMCGMPSVAEDVAMGMAIPSVTTDEFEQWFKKRSAVKDSKEHEEAVFGEIHAQQARAAKALSDARAKEGKVGWHEPLKMLMLVFRAVKDWKKRRREKDYVVELPGAAAALAEEKSQAQVLQP